MPHLVLADDSVTIQKVVELSFADENLEVHCFGDGSSALEFMRSHPVDVLLADVSLPLLDGYQLCREVRRSPDTAHLPVILLASTFEPIDSAEAERSGCHAHLTKPFETSRLVELVKSVLAHPPALSAQPKPASLRPQPEGLLFRIPFEDGGEEEVFSLTLSQCQPLWRPLKRQVQITPPKAATPESVPEKPALSESALDLTPEQLDLLVGKVLERLPDELRRILPLIAPDVLGK